MVVLKQLAECEEVERKGVPRFVPGIAEVHIAALVPAPIHNASVDRPHDEVKRKEKKEPCTRREDNIEEDVHTNPQKSYRPCIREFIERFPFWNIFIETFFRFDPVKQIVEINILHPQHHLKHAAEILRGVRILFRVAVGMMHPVHDRISARIEEGRPLCNK